MTLTSSRSKIPTCMLHTTPRPKFSSDLLYDELFISYSTIFGKVPWMTQNDVEMFNVKIPICMLHTLPRPKFLCVSFYNKPFLSYWPIFGKEAYFYPIGSGFGDTSRFSKLPYLNMKLSKWPKFQKLHIYTLSTQRGRNWAYFGVQAAFSEIRNNFQTSHIWAWNLASD